jgi:1-acyl-sn-glycerol-3-phosphate acyltransferase
MIAGLLFSAALRGKSIRVLLQHGFDAFERFVMPRFMRVWHGFAPEGPDPLPEHGPAMIIANHPCHADPGFLIAACQRKLHFLQASECYHVPGMRWFFRLVGCMPVRRGGQDIGAVRAALRSLKDGNVWCMFPEGEVCLAGGDEVGPFKTGSALLALRSGAPVYPAWIEEAPATRRMLLAWLWPSRGTRVIFGARVDLSQFADRPITRDLLHKVTDLLRQRIVTLSPKPWGMPAAPRGEPQDSLRGACGTPWGLTERCPP